MYKVSVIMVPRALMTKVCASSDWPFLNCMGVLTMILVITPAAGFPAIVQFFLILTGGAVSVSRSSPWACIAGSCGITVNCRTWSFGIPINRIDKLTLMSDWPKI